MKVRFTSVGDEFLQPLFFTSQSLHPRVVFLTFSVCVGTTSWGFPVPLFSGFWIHSTGGWVNHRKGVVGTTYIFSVQLLKILFIQFQHL
jgi:hypothetical protein